VTWSVLSSACLAIIVCVVFALPSALLAGPFEKLLLSPAICPSFGWSITAFAATDTMILEKNNVQISAFIRNWEDEHVH
jgi:hypothetical protein